MSWRVETGDCVERMAAMSAGSIDAIVTDPPYGLEFMGAEWDAFGRDTGNGYREKPRITDRRESVGGYATKTRGTVNSFQAGTPFQRWCEHWGREALRVLKPGGHLVSFGGTRTYHRMVAGVEDAGFEIRDQLAWLFGSGFPKSRNLGGGRGTALKPAHEPIVLARKPFLGSAAATVELHGTGALNIDACKIPVVDVDEYERNCSGDRGHYGTRPMEERGATDMRMGGGSASGARWPANVVLDEEAGELLDEQTGTLTSGANPTRRSSDKFRNVYGDFAGQEECEPKRGVDRGGASRFFYCAKTSAEERSAGLDPARWPDGNPHPTVKPVELMRWLVCLVTPPGGGIAGRHGGLRDDGNRCRA